MADGPTDEVDGYLRAAIVTSDHPGKPLEGTVVAMSTSHNLSVDEPYLGEVVTEANERFDINSYASELRLGTVYFDASTRNLVGVKWEESPCPYHHGEFDEPVEALPDNLLPVSEE